MSDLIKWILRFLALVFLAPSLNMVHQDFHARFILTVSQFNPQLAELSFTIFQAMISIMFALTVIYYCLSIGNEKEQFARLWLLISVMPVILTYLVLVFIT